MRIYVITAWTGEGRVAVWDYITHQVVLDKILGEREGRERPGPADSSAQPGNNQNKQIIQSIDQ